ncbi:glyoxalase superfamily protein [Labrenzia sp. CE80]|uniref:glyoxalase superfamily protein n=1 Tax=Labrenzia sp. CE80 TaxID=1788986 RepID=UPI00129A9412|nr:glyoxalase superfamily protein [Labrenzia sp. CE80]
MTLSTLPPLSELKAQAKRLRAALPAATDAPLNHGQSLDLVARQYGFRDWNTLHAAKGNAPNIQLSLGQKVSGTYLHQAFQGEIVSAAKVGPSDRTRITIVFDEPVDVVSFDSFSAFRQRVTVTLGNDGKTAEKTSDGVPHMQLTTAI